MRNDDVKFMRLAIKKAREGIRKGQTPFGACIVRAGKVIACSHNIVWKACDITAHAEINAIRQACKKLKTIDLAGCTIYSTCEPCPMCFAACHWAGIRRIVFGCGIEVARDFGFNELSISNLKMKGLAKSGVKILPGVLAEESAGLFRLWQKQPNRRAY
ncbi:MAG: nucleoside deaminase [Candidatus Omnitrophica bacterium]|nr:nucleoside deaminase [Candidatus Omnitrophota bacterium]